MSAPRATWAQLVPVIEQKLLAGDPTRSERALLVHADPRHVPETTTVAGRTVQVTGSSSPLQIRALLRRAGDDGAYVVLTDCDPASLGDDVLARAVGRKVHRLDRWATVCALFGAQRPTADLARRPHLADALIESRPLAGYPKVTTRVLDLDTATAALVRVALGIADDVDDLAGFLAWAGRPEAAGRLVGASTRVLDDLVPTLETRFGPGVHAVLAAVAAGRSTDLVPLGLIAAAVHHTDGPDAAAPAARLDEWLGRPGLAPTVQREWGRGAAEVVERAEPPRAAGLLDRADALLTDLDAVALAQRSDLLPTGFEQRIATAAAALTAWHGKPDDAGLADAAHAAIARVQAHRSVRNAGDRLDRLRMAARLIRRRSLQLTGLESLDAVTTAYLRDGAWLDAARTSVSRSDRDPAFAALCDALRSQADAARAEQGLLIARTLAAAAHPLPAGLLGVEDVLADVVAPLAQQRPVLLLVLDGLGLPTFCDVLDAIEGTGWVPHHRDGTAGEPVAVAALPTVTEISRTSLLTGTLRRGDGDSETRGFAQHPGLRDACAADAPPVLFHKRDLRTGGLDTLPTELLDAVADARRRIVGLVINTIDERLKDVAQPVAGWTIGELDPLRHVLTEARRVGRAVVLCADHGHLLDRDAEARPASGGGERWRLPDPPAGPGELEVRGPRVVADAEAIVMPWAEQLRYGPRRNGYHGGLTPQELLVPLTVLSVDDLDGWTPTTTRRPPWWHHAPIVVPSPAPTPLPPAQVAPTLFDPEPAPSVDAPAAGPAPPAADLTSPWVEQALATDALTERLASPRVRLRADEVRRLLTVLDAAAGTTLVEARLAEEAQVPVGRIGRYVAQLQELCNIDGYPVITYRDGEIRFDRSLLDRQLGL